MNRLIIAVAVAALLATPLAAQSLSILLPSILFPDPTTTTSTKDCVTTAATVCPNRH